MANESEGTDWGQRGPQPDRYAVPLRDSNKVVYILGAGFSNAAGIPLVARFIGEALHILKKADPKVADKLANILARNANVRQWSRIDLFNLEELFCLLEPPYGDRQDRDDLTDAIVKTIIAAHKANAPLDSEGIPMGAGGPTVPRRHLFRSSKYAGKGGGGQCYGVSVYEAFVSYVLSRQETERQRDVYDLDTVITFNYDLTLELAIQSFTNACIHYGDGVVARGRTRPDWVWLERTPQPNGLILPIIKLHGSINWVCDDNTKYSVVSGVQDPFRESPEPTKIPLVPPSWRKDAIPESIFERMTLESVSHLQRASEIVIIGYSMPPTDLDFRFLLGRSLATPEPPRIRVYDTKPPYEMELRIRDCFSDDLLSRERVKYYPTGLAGFVKSHVSREVLEPGHV